MPIQKTEIDKAPYIAYADKPGMIYDGSGGGGGGSIDVGDICYIGDDTNNISWGISAIYYGDVKLFDDDANAPYEPLSGFGLAMGLILVLRPDDSSSMADYTLDYVKYGESMDPDDILDPSMYNWDSESNYFTITIPKFEATLPGLRFAYTYN